MEEIVQISTDKNVIELIELLKKNQMEREAANGGCVESILFVADSNATARTLYEKCGYRDLRQESYGKYMIKELKTGL